MGSRRYALAEIADINSAQYSPKERWPLIQYLDTGSVTRGHIDALQQLEPGTDKVPGRARRKVKNGSIVYSMVRPNQEHYALLADPPANMLASTGFAVIDAKTNLVTPEYLYYALIHPDTTAYFQALAEQVVSTYPTLGKDNLARYEIDVPSLSEQRAIATLLGSFDEMIALNQQTNDYLLQLATALFEGALETERREETFADIVELEDSKRIPLNSRDREQRKGPYPYYGATSIMGYVDDYLFDGLRILLGEDGSVITDDGRPVLQYVWGKYWVNNHAHILKPRADYSLEMLYVALNRTSIPHIVTGAVQKKISQKNLNTLVLEMPNPLQVKGLDEIFSLYRANVDQNKRLEHLRDALLPKLMSGEIDVSQIELPKSPNNHLSAG